MTQADTIKLMLYTEFWELIAYMVRFQDLGQSSLYACLPHFHVAGASLLLEAYVSQ